MGGDRLKENALNRILEEIDVRLLFAEPRVGAGDGDGWDGEAVDERDEELDDDFVVARS